MWLCCMLLVCLVQAAEAFIYVPDAQRVAPDSRVLLKTPIGVLLGRGSALMIDGHVKPLTTFKGIPYAEPPVGNLRFEKPVPKAPFTSTFHATKFGPACLQMFTGPVNSFSEDCLSLNVFVPSVTVPPSATKPVMIWIHGGGFQSGASFLYDLERLSANGDVIIVSINYRLAQLGFLRINSSYIPGNYGLWDQHLAIKWVHDNIRAFGGDPNNVTIFGESAGSSSVMYQATYHGNKGLFQRAIAESGSTSSSWAQMDETRAQEGARAFAARLGCNTTDDQAMIGCLKLVPEDKLIQVINGSLYFERVFAPSYDGEFVAVEQSQMFKRSPATAASLDFFNSLDLIIGVNRGDGLTFAPQWAYMLGQRDFESLTVTRQEFENKLIPFFLTNDDNHKNISDAVKAAVLYAYTDWDNLDDMNSRLRNLVNFQTDFDFTLPCLRALGARNNSTGSSYFYEFAFKPTKWIIPAINSVSDESMATHGDEVPFVFDAVGENATSDEQTMAKAMSTMWINFVKTGDPNQPEDIRQYYPVTWPQYDHQTQQYLEFSHHMSPQSVKARLHATRMALWRYLIPEMEQNNMPSA